ncbi:hypothetical protein ACI6Q2_21755 [Chitinophagaceae bacterium LWZ2-11]
MEEGGNIIRIIGGESNHIAKEIDIRATEGSVTFTAAESVKMYSTDGKVIYGDYVSRYDFIPFISLEKNDSIFKITETKQCNNISAVITDTYKAKSEQIIKFRATIAKQDLVSLVFKIEQGNSEAKDPDGNIWVKYTFGNGKSKEDALGLKKYGDTIPLTIMSNCIMIDFYFQDNYTDFFDRAGSVLTKENCGRIAIDKCFCGRDLTIEELKSIVTQLRKKDNIHMETQFSPNRNKLFEDKDGKVIPSDDRGRMPPNGVKVHQQEKSFYDEIGLKIFDLKYLEKIKDGDANFETFTKELNNLFNKYEINTCLRKIHFLGQAYQETLCFRLTYEKDNDSMKNYNGGSDFRGRGLIQVTHNGSYLNYYNYLNKTGEKIIVGNVFYENILKPFCKKLSTEMKYACDSAGWNWKFDGVPSVGKDINLLADKDDVLLVSRAINGNVTTPNGFENRKKYTTLLKTIMKYDECANKK